MEKVSKRILTGIVFTCAFLAFFAFGKGVFAQTQVCTHSGLGTCNSSCVAQCPPGYSNRTTPEGLVCQVVSPCSGNPTNSCCYLNGVSNSSSCCFPNPTPTPIPASLFRVVKGKVVDQRTGKGIYGAKIIVHKVDDKYGLCVGAHFGCSPETIVTDKEGNWSSICINEPMKSIYVKEIQNPAGYFDAVTPSVIGGSVWDKNTVCYESVARRSVLNPITFYDKN